MHTPPRSSYFDVPADHIQWILRVRRVRPFGSRRPASLIVGMHRAQADRRRQGERALSDWRGRQVGPASPCEPGLTLYQTVPKRRTVPPGNFYQFESIAPACQIRLRGVSGSIRITK